MSLSLLNIAHRGASAQAPENTLVAFERALQLGAQMIEFDVRMTRDGSLVVIHDATLDRTTNQTGLVSSYTLAELRSMAPDTGAWFDQAFAGQTLLTLEEALSWARGKAPVLIDLQPGNPQSAADVVVEHIQRLKLLEAATVTSQDLGLGVRARRIDRRVQVAFDLTRTLQWQLVTFPGRPQNFAGLVVQHDLIDDRFVDAAFARGWFVYARTVNDVNEMARLARLSVQGIITDAPDVLAGLLLPSGRP